MKEIMKVIVNENASRSLLVSFLPNISYTTGIWSSVFSLNLLDAWYISVDSEDFWHKWTRDKITDIGELFLYYNGFFLLLFFFLTLIFFFQSNFGIPSSGHCVINMETRRKFMLGTIV